MTGRKYTIDTTAHRGCRMVTEAWQTPDATGAGGQHMIRYCTRDEDHDGSCAWGPWFIEGYTTMSFVRVKP